MKNSTYNDIGISRQLDLPRIKKLLTIGVFASLLHLIGDIMLGSGTEDASLDGIARMLSAYTSTSDGGIFAAALLGLFGMTLEGLAMFGIYRLIADRSPKYAHSYRSGILGYLIFGACGYHVPTCALVFLQKHGVSDELTLRFAGYFLLPAVILFFVFFIVLSVAQIIAFVSENTPLPRHCLIYCIPIGMIAALLPNVFGNLPWVNALTCAWIAVGNLWMFGGLLTALCRAKNIK